MNIELLYISQPGQTVISSLNSVTVILQAYKVICLFRDGPGLVSGLHMCWKPCKTMKLCVLSYCPLLPPCGKCNHNNINTISLIPTGLNTLLSK